MFRRLADMASAAVSGGGHASADENVQQLQAMGFSASQARQALASTGGNVERAAELILSGTMTSPEVVDVTGDDDVRLQNALEESRQSEEQRLYRQAQEASIAQNYRIAAGNRAAQAAAQRAAAAAAAAASNNRTNAPVHFKRTQAKKPFKQESNKPAATKKTAPSVPQPTPATISHENPTKVAKTPHVGVSRHHPNVKLPAKFQDKSKEEQVLRCANRLKPYPLAVDTLYRALTAIQQDPSNAKFRKIDKTTRGYKRSLESVPGAEALLLAMNFQTHGAYSLVLERSWVDQALLYLGISALEGAKESEEYKEAKAKLAFQQEIAEIQRLSNASEAEAIRRAEFMAKCPSEPTGGRGALMQVVISDETTIRRKFDGDDVLRDVLNWIGGHGSVIPEKILSREWCVVDINRFPIAPMDCELNLDKTLQYIGCWPSGRLELRPSPQTWKKDGNQGQVLMGSSRGLAAAPTEAMH
jgi:hypothetical protein